MAVAISIWIALCRQEGGGTNIPPTGAEGSFSNDDFSLEWF